MDKKAKKGLRGNKGGTNTPQGLREITIFRDPTNLEKSFSFNAKNREEFSILLNCFQNILFYDIILQRRI